MERTADNKAALTLTVSGAANASTSTKKVYVTVDDSALNIAQADVKTTENASALVKAVTGSIEGVAMNSANSGDKENLVVNGAITAFKVDATLTGSAVSYAETLSAASFTFDHMPAGLSVSAVERSSATKAILTISGTPTATQSAASLGKLTIAAAAIDAKVALTASSDMTETVTVLDGSTLTFHSNTNAAATYVQAVASAKANSFTLDALSEMTEIVNPGYMFLGWSRAATKGADETLVADKATYTELATCKDLYAQWAAADISFSVATGNILGMDAEKLGDYTLSATDNGQTITVNGTSNYITGFTNFEKNTPDGNFIAMAMTLSGAANGTNFANAKMKISGNSATFNVKDAFTDNSAKTLCNLVLRVKPGTIATVTVYWNGDEGATGTTSVYTVKVDDSSLTKIVPPDKYLSFRYFNESPYAGTMTAKEDDYGLACSPMVYSVFDAQNATTGTVYAWGTSAEQTDPYADFGVGGNFVAIRADLKGFAKSGAELSGELNNSTSYLRKWDVQGTEYTATTKKVFDYFCANESDGDPGMIYCVRLLTSEEAGSVTAAAGITATEFKNMLQIDWENDSKSATTTGFEADLSYTLNYSGVTKAAS